jgi:hypothetical protein
MTQWKKGGGKTLGAPRRRIGEERELRRAGMDPPIGEEEELRGGRVQGAAEPSREGSDRTELVIRVLTERSEEGRRCRNALLPQDWLLHHAAPRR